MGSLDEDQIAEPLAPLLLVLIETVQPETVPVGGRTYISQIAHAAGMLTVIFLDRGWSDPTSLTFNA